MPAKPIVDPDNPTDRTYSGLDKAYDHFNDVLFGSELPRCLITMQRKKGCYGYFAPTRFGRRDGSTVTDEIALNPAAFKQQMMDDTLSTLVHEMVHLWQHHFGEPSRSGYHNREWAQRMHDVGLIPSSTGQPGGKQTGQKMDHYIAANGPFSKACVALRKPGFDPFYVEMWDEDADKKKAKKKKAASKTKYVCPECAVQAWGKPSIHLICGECGVDLVEEVIALSEE